MTTAAFVLSAILTGLISGNVVLSLDEKVWPVMIEGCVALAASAFVTYALATMLP